MNNVASASPSSYRYLSVTIGANVLINEAATTTTQASQTRFKETAASVQLKSGYVEAVQGAVKSIETARTAKKDTGSDRMAGLATLNAAVNVYNTASALAGSASQQGSADQLGGNASASAAPISAISISGSLGQSKSQSNSTSGQSIAQGSMLAAGNNLTIVANGDKSKGEGNLTAVGANLSAGKEATLDASGDLNLLASSNTATSRSTNSGSNASLGATFALGGAQNGLSFQAGAQGSKGKANGDEVTYNNTTVTVGTAQTPGTLTQTIRPCFSGVGGRSTPARLIRLTLSCGSTKSNSDRQLRQVRYSPGYYRTAEPG